MLMVVSKWLVSWGITLFRGIISQLGVNYNSYKVVTHLIIIVTNYH